jgi:hypothetical protein
MSRKSLVVALYFAAFASLSSAETLTIGNTVGSVNTSSSAAATPTTDIALDNPATATGLVGSVTFRWSSFPCTSAVKIKFFSRRGDTLVYTGERGPFNVTGATNTVTLPGLGFAVDQGDLIGITRLGSCGNGVALTGIVSNGFVTYSGDITSDVALSAGARKPGYLAVAGTGVAILSVARTIPAVASAAGAFGSTFKTGMQLFNPAPAGSASVDAQIVFHAAGHAGIRFDPTLNVTLGPQRSVYYPDIVAAIGQTGLGSIDVITAVPTPQLVITTRVYNDAGAAGTSGFNEPALSLNDSGSDGPILVAGSTSYLLAPPDPAKSRLNIGIRTLFQSVTVNVTVRDSTGTQLGSTVHTYPPTWFEQTTAAAFTGLATIPANASIQIGVSGGSAIIYGATTDNTTNDGSVAFATNQFVVQ